ncbi:hypothetical protein [Brevundimonas sp.]|uniref:hypothetical protein n=1 Tax=Brevundimonas sp. TaxID=1871086 RepID=UPI0025B9F66F|nr:hypothetical protein [Brevundimonas sp.]
MFTVYFSHATTTPFQPGLRQLVEAALVDSGAERTGLEAEVRLNDGALLYLFGEDENEGMLAEYPVLTPTVAEALFAILSRTNSFLLGDLRGAALVRLSGVVGEPRAPLIFAPQITEFESADDLLELLKQIHESREDSEPASRPTPAPAARRPSKPGPGSFILDLLFGKAV